MWLRCSFVQPFWQVVNYLDSRGRGVVGKKLFKVSYLFFFNFFLFYDFIFNFLPMLNIFISGVLEANFVEPTHNKQEFEKTSLFQKLECRLKEMTFEYWLVFIYLFFFLYKLFYL